MCSHFRNDLSIKGRFQKTFALGFLNNALCYLSVLCASAVKPVSNDQPQRRSGRRESAEAVRILDSLSRSSIGMHSLTPAILVVTLLFAGCTRPDVSRQSPTPPQLSTHPGVLRVCADPNNLPFSNNKGEGFENKLAELIAKDLNEKVQYTWWAQRRGFFRNTLKADACDLVVGVPAGFEMAATTSPYYRSTYVFVSREDRNLHISSFDDPKLRELRIGVQMIGDDFNNSPPAHALTKRQIIQNVRGYTVYGDYAQPNPPARIVDAVVNKQIDLAIVWGPLAGYFAKQQRAPLSLVPVTPQIDQPFLPFVYDISMGVRRGDQTLKDQLELILENHRSEINKLLDDYGVPRVDEGKGVPNENS